MSHIPLRAHLMEQVEFSAEDMRAMDDLAKERIRFQRANREMAKYPKNTLIGFTQGCMAEWAFADAIGLPRPTRIPPVDCHFDLGGVKVRVQYANHRRTPKLMYDDDKDPTKADVMVLVMPGEQPHQAVLVGGTARFYELEHAVDYGYGKTHVVDHWSLTPWRYLRTALIAL